MGIFQARILVAGKPKNVRMRSLSLLQGIFPTQGSNWGLLHCRWILYQLSYQESPYNMFYIYKYTHIHTHVCVCILSCLSCPPPGDLPNLIFVTTQTSSQAPLSMGFFRHLEWLAIASSSGSFQPTDQTHVFLCLLHWQAGSLLLTPPGKLSHVQLFGNPMDYSPPGLSVHGISQTRILEWVDISSSRGSY